MEKLGQLASNDAWDLVIVDTPPSRNALDFLDAPQRLGTFLDGRDDPAALGTRPWPDQARGRRDGIGPEGCLDHRGKPNAFGCIGIRAVARLDVRRFSVNAPRRPTSCCVSRGLISW